MGDGITMRGSPVTPGRFTIAPPVESGLHAKSIAWLNTEMTKMVMGPAPPAECQSMPGSSNLSAMAHLHYAKQRAMEDWQRVCAAYQVPTIDYLMRLWSRPNWRAIHPACGQGKDRSPKWGQPGRGRRRKARLRARAHEVEARRLLGEVRGLADGALVPLMIAALYVQPNGTYYGIEDVDPWPEARDARTYAGPWAVVCHSPCSRWGRYWSGGPSAKVRLVKGDDGGCFAAALLAVRTWGGVLEHPEASAAWRAHGLLAPPRADGWVAAGDNIGWTCCVEQGRYGHAARKATWLYVAQVQTLPSLRWGRSAAGMKFDDGYHSTEERRRLQKLGTLSGQYKSADGMSQATWRAATPAPFRDLLLSIARSVVIVGKVLDHPQKLAVG